MTLEISDVDRSFSFYWLLLNTWHRVSPKWRYQKQVKLWLLYVSFVATNGKECAFLIVPIISLGHYPFLFTKNLFTSSCLNLEKILFVWSFLNLVKLHILWMQSWHLKKCLQCREEISLYLFSFTYMFVKIFVFAYNCVVAVLYLYLYKSVCVFVKSLIIVSFALLNKETMISLWITMVSSPRRSVFADD